MTYLERIHIYLKTLVDFELRELAPLQGRYARVSYRAKEKIFLEGETYRKVTFVLSGLLKK